jgi:hypothetical protein
MTVQEIFGGNLVSPSALRTGRKASPPEAVAVPKLPSAANPDASSPAASQNLKSFSMCFQAHLRRFQNLLLAGEAPPNFRCECILGRQSPNTIVSMKLLNVNTFHSFILLF